MFTAAVFGLADPPHAAANAPAPPSAGACGAAWTAVWHASPVLYTARPAGPFPFDDGPTADEIGFSGRTARTIVAPTTSGTAVRLHFSNRYGGRPLWIGTTRVAWRRNAATLVAGTSRVVKFGGHANAVIPSGGEITSDPVDISAAVGHDLAVSYYLVDARGSVTRHLDTHTTSFLSDSGDHAADETPGAFTTRTLSSIYLTGVDVLVPTRVDAVVAVGDSITDGVGTNPDAAARWTDVLQRRLDAAGGARDMTVLNAAIGANRLLTDSPYHHGDGALSRFSWDIAPSPGVTDVILHEGTNDIGLESPRRSATDITNGMRRFADLAHARGLRVFATTITPSSFPPYATPRAIRMRDDVNRWITRRGPSYFDGVFDFAAAVSDPTSSRRIARPFDSGDGLHLSEAGSASVAGAIDIAKLSGSPCLRSS